MTDLSNSERDRKPNVTCPGCGAAEHRRMGDYTKFVCGCIYHTASLAPVVEPERCAACGKHEEFHRDHDAACPVFAGDDSIGWLATSFTAAPVVEPEYQPGGIYYDPETNGAPVVRPEQATCPKCGDTDRGELPVEVLGCDHAFHFPVSEQVTPHQTGNAMCPCERCEPEQPDEHHDLPREYPVEPERLFNDCDECGHEVSVDVGCEHFPKRKPINPAVEPEQRPYDCGRPKSEPCGWAQPRECSIVHAEPEQATCGLEQHCPGDEDCPRWYNHGRPDPSLQDSTTNTPAERVRCDHGSWGCNVCGTGQAERARIRRIVKGFQGRHSYWSEADKADLLAAIDGGPTDAVTCKCCEPMRLDADSGLLWCSNDHTREAL